MTEPQRCGTCKWFSQTVGSFGDCMCWATLDRKTNPESAKVVKVVMAKWQGKRCPCWARKESDDATDTRHDAEGG